MAGKSCARAEPKSLPMQFGETVGTGMRWTACVQTRRLAFSMFNNGSYFSEMTWDDSDLDTVLQQKLGGRGDLGWVKLNRTWRPLFVFL